MEWSGYTGRVLRIDLTKRASSSEDLSHSDCRDFIGSRGLGALLFSRIAKPGIDPFSPDNPLVFMTGPLTQTKFLSTPKYAAITKSPLTGFYTESLASGKLASNLKSLGYDGMVITGKAEAPCYVSMNPEGIRFHEASSLWGLNTLDTRSALCKEFGKKAEVLSIGPSGERLVPMACIFSGTRTHGRGGAGAVMGSKGLKAIVVGEGAARTRLFDPEAFNEVFQENTKRLKEANIRKGATATFGTPYLVSFIHELGMMPICNFRSGIFKGIKEISGERLLEKHVTQSRVCSRCWIPCEKISVTRGTSFPETRVRGPEYESLWALGPNCGVSDLDAIIVSARMCDELGIDTISVGVAISFAMELVERGLLKKGDVDGLELDFGNGASVIEMVKKVGLGQGIGKILGAGVKQAAQRISSGSDRYAMHVKGMEIPAYDPRGAVGMGLGYATSPRGACHLKAWTVSKEAVEQRETRYSYEQKAPMVKEMQDYRTGIDCTGLCINAGRGVDAELLANLLHAIAGFDMTAAAFREVGERVWNLERMLAVSEGIDRKDDTLPDRFFEEPLPDGPAKGAMLNRPGFEKMLSEYYNLRGWDVQTGIPTYETVKKFLGSIPWKEMAV